MNNKLGVIHQDCVLNTFSTWLFRGTDSIFPTHRRESLEGHHCPYIVECHRILWSALGNVGLKSIRSSSVYFLKCQCFIFGVISCPDNLQTLCLISARERMTDAGMFSLSREYIYPGRNECSLEEQIGDTIVMKKLVYFSLL